MNYQELIERLRDTNRHTFALWFEAADAIESLLAENERLKAECDEWEANSKQWEQEYYKKDTELAKYRDAPVVASAAVSNSSDTFRPVIKFDYGVELRMAVPASGKPIALIVKPVENK